MLGYSSINQDIRRNPYNPNKWKSETQGTVRVLNEVLKKIPPLQENILLMRILIL
jgi:hypothetical protein